MKLPGGDAAVVSRSKLQRYLLSPTHPVGRTKARFFAACGYRLADASRLRQELLRIAAEDEIVQTTHTRFGTKHAVDGMLQTPLRIAIPLRTVWIVERTDARPRFITAYPAPER